MKRGDVIVAGQHGAFTGKPRPYVIVQNGLGLEVHPTVSVCPLTTKLTGAYLVRIAAAAGDATGLLAPSEIEVDKVTTLRRSAIAEVIGTIPDATMREVDAALRRWLDL